MNAWRRVYAPAASLTNTPLSPKLPPNVCYVAAVMPTARRLVPAVHTVSWGFLAVAAWVLACGPGEPEGTSDQPSTADTSSGDPTTGASTGTTPPGSSSDATAEGPTSSSSDATAGEPSACAQLCARSIECEVSVTLDGCIADCEALDPTLLSCLLACDQAVCDDFLLCTSVCAQPGDPTAPPYGSCEAPCQPGVIVCIATSYPDGSELSVCAPFCNEDQSCPVPETGAAPPVCDLEARPPVCRLDCSAGQPCPDDMVCDAGLCTWVVG